jgi:8-oxo-dGTP diphosphatase
LSDARSYPDRPYLAVSAAIIRDGRVLIVRRARPPAEGVFTLPGGAVEVGESLQEALLREVREETALTVDPIALAGHREVIHRDGAGRVERHFVILAFAARWIAGEPVLNAELTEARWMLPTEIDGLQTTEGLADIVRAAFARTQP